MERRIVDGKEDNDWGKVALKNAFGAFNRWPK